MRILSMITASGLGAALLLSAATVAAQQSAAIMPAFGGHREIPASVHQEARQAALEFLRTEDLIVLDPTRVAAMLDETQAACAPRAECATDVRAALGIDLLVGLVVWGASGAPETPETVHASVLDASGTRFVGSATVQQGVATAVRDALRSALRDQRRGPGPFLQVSGTEGGVCEVDGAAVGTIPLTVRVPPGEHELRVALEGYQPHTVTVTIGDDAARTTEVEVELRPLDGGSETPGGSGGIAEWAIPVGIVGIVVGVGVAVAVPVASVAMTGCAETIGGACTESNRFAVAENAGWIVAGGVLAVLGVTLVIVGASEGSGDGRVRARIGPGHLTLEGSF